MGLGEPVLGLGIRAHLRIFRFVSAASDHSAAEAWAIAWSTRPRLRRTELAAVAAWLSRSWKVTGGFVLSRRRIEAHALGDPVGGAQSPRAGYGRHFRGNGL